MTTTTAASPRRKTSVHRFLALFMGLTMSAVVVGPGTVLTSAPAVAAEQPVPQLTSLKRVSPATTTPGSTVQIGFTLVQRADRVVFTFTDESLVTEHRIEWSGTPAAGPLTATASASVTADAFFQGSHKLQSVIINYGSETLTYFRGTPSQYNFPVSWESLDFTVNNPAKVLTPNNNLDPPSLGIRKEAGYSYLSFAVQYGTWSAPPTAYTYEWFRDGIRQSSDASWFHVPDNLAGTGSGLTLKLTAMAAGRLPETVETAPFYLVDAADPHLPPNVSVRTPSRPRSTPQPSKDSLQEPSRRSATNGWWTSQSLLPEQPAPPTAPSQVRQERSSVWQRW
ncbi:hypothetical protein [Arthrobacter sp. StoSoilA2]|uniref:hypothetical protein n=1 Tax=Arthrobacter sp. StoSoilA2 TaxID=2830990 RepID=UPI001CC4C2C3|nr:hypothetical protein [Arthrobacter sp. StoSoilA2]